MTPSPTSLAARLKSRTQAWHTTSERSAYMRRLLRGQVDREGYGELLYQLLGLYEALESGLDQHARHQAVAPIRLPGLARSQALQQDLFTLFGPAWSQRFALTHASEALIRQVTRCTLHAPHRLVAHAYVRYLGDLHGGQVLARIVRTSLQLGPREDATRFHDFGPPPRVAALITSFRVGLDALPLEPDEAEEIVTEACEAFAAHVRLFDELEAAAA